MRKKKKRMPKGFFPKASYESMRKALVKMEPGKVYTVDDMKKILGVGTSNRAIDVMSTPKVLGFVEKKDRKGYVLTKEGAKLKEFIKKENEAGVKRVLREAIRRSEFYSFIEKLRKKGLSLDEMVKEAMEKFNYKTKDVKGFKYRVVGSAMKLCEYAHEGMEVVVEKKENLYYMLGKMAGLIMGRYEEMDTKKILEEFEKLLYNIQVDEILLKLFEKEKKVILDRDDLSLLQPFLEVLEDEMMR